MISWIQSIWDSIVGTINDVKNWLLSLINAIWSYLSTLYSWANDFIWWVYRQAVWFYNQAVNYAYSVWTYAVWIVTSVIPAIYRWATSWLNSLWGWIRSFASWATSQLEWVAHYIESLINGVTNWVIHSVWEPLWNTLSGAVRWIAHEGAYILWLVTHPDQLVKLLGKYLWLSWIDLLHAYGRPIGRWLARRMMGAAGDVASILEEILSAML